MKNILKLTLGTSILSIMSPLVAQDILLNDTFSNGNRTTQDLPTSAAWYSSSSSGLDVVSGGLQRTGTGATTLAYFTDSGAVSLGVGESIELSYTVVFTDPSGTSSGYRMGLYNSNGDTRISSDSFSNSDFTNYEGYFGTTSLGGGSNSVRGIKKDNTVVSLMSVGLGNYDILQSGGDSSQIFLGGNTYDATFTLTRTDASTIDGTIAFTGLFDGDVTPSSQGLSFSDTSSIFTSFDTVAFFASNGLTDYTIDNVQLSYTSVPEPATTALLISVGLLGVVIVRRRQRN